MISCMEALHLRGIQEDSLDYLVKGGMMKNQERDYQLYRGIILNHYTRVEFDSLPSLHDDV
jgi:hypothetical protein